MNYVKFGRTGIAVSDLCLGTATFGKQTDEPTSIQIMDKAAEAGINFIDTADMYPMNAAPGEVGRSEEIVGRWLKGKRTRFIVGSKAGGPAGPSQWDQGSSRKHVLDAIDGSLKRLDIDYIDLYQLHFDDPNTSIDEACEALNAIVRSGKARYIGISNILGYRLARYIGRQETLRLAKFVSVQPRYSLLSREIEKDLLPLALEDGLAVTPFNPLAGGLLTGKYRIDKQPEEGRFSAQNGQFGTVYRSRYWREREFAAIEQLSKIAKANNIALPTLAISWALANPIITSVILGASKTGQLDATLAATDFVVTTALKSELDDVTLEFCFELLPALTPSRLHHLRNVKALGTREPH